MNFKSIELGCFLCWLKTLTSTFFFLIGNEDFDIEHHHALKIDPENFIYDCLTVEDVEKLLNEAIECLCNSIKCAPSLAKTLLLEHRWSINEIVKRYRENSSELLVSCSFDIRISL